jgi:hypothetical protein
MSGACRTPSRLALAVAAAAVASIEAIAAVDGVAKDTFVVAA